MLGLIAKHKKIFSLLALFALMFWLITLQVKSGRFSVLERPVLAISGFFERAVTGSYGAARSAWRGYVFTVSARRENRRLREELSRLQLENQITSELLQENDRLREALGFRKLTPPTAVMAEVVGKEVSPSSSTFVINKGADDGVQRDAAVITASGVVGRTQSVLRGTSKVILLTDPGSTLAVRVQRNREEGLLEGKIGLCALKYVSYYADIKEGDLLITSGMDGIYPKGLPVATVVKVSKHEAKAFQSVVAEPVVKLSRLEEVLVLRK